jgi:UDP:flavonoid glycosyltransferase YjiC (YdhE family)
MRVVFTAWAWPSHLYAMVPLAWACRAQGHEVVVASQPALTGVILGTGLPAAPVGHDVDAVAAFRAIAAGPGAPGAPSGPRVLGLLGALAEAMAADLVTLVRDWQADLVVFEPTALAGPLAAAAAGIPAVRHLYGTDLMSVAERFLPAVLGPLGSRLGVDARAAVNPFGLASVDPCPAALQVPVLGSRRLPVRYVPYNGQGLLPQCLLPQHRAASGRPRVCVTWGTTLSRLDPEFFLAGQVARAVSGQAVDVVVAVTPAQRLLLGPLPSSALVAESVPLHLLLADCDLVVSHGGAGTLLTALASGLPQLLIPRLPDHVRHAERLTRAGAGAALPAPADDQAIRDRVTELLQTPSYRTQARRLQREMAGQPAPCRLVGELAALASTTRARIPESSS